MNTGRRRAVRKGRGGEPDLHLVTLEPVPIVHGRWSPCHILIPIRLEIATVFGGIQVDRCSVSTNPLAAGMSTSPLVRSTGTIGSIGNGWATYPYGIWSWLMLSV